MYTPCYVFGLLVKELRFLILLVIDDSACFGIKLHHFREIIFRQAYFSWNLSWSVSIHSHHCSPHQFILDWVQQDSSICWINFLFLYLLIYLKHFFYLVRVRKLKLMGFRFTKNTTQIKQRRKNYQAHWKKKYWVLMQKWTERIFFV